MSNRFYWLQFFADGASGGDGGEGESASGENTADAGRSLEDLGVPKEVAERHRHRAEKRRGKSVQTSALADEDPVHETGTETRTDSAEGPEAPPKEAENPNNAGDDWDTFFSNPTNKSRLEQMMAERGRRATEARNAAQALMDKVNPTLKLLGEMYGVQPNEDGSYDPDAINKAVAGDDKLYESKALELGVSVDVAKKLAHADELDRQQQEAEARANRQAVIRRHFAKVQQEATQLRELYPDFDLDRELQNPEFVRRTAPGGLSVEEAYYSLHHKEIMQREREEIARKAKLTAAAAVQSGSARPRENGSASAAAAAVTPNMRAMSHEQRLAYIQKKYPPIRRD